eukprot:scaffold25.g5120.t1
MADRRRGDKPAGSGLRPPEADQAIEAALLIWRGKRARGEAKLEELQRDSPSAASCLALCKLRIEDAVNVVLKEDVDDAERDARVLDKLAAAFDAGVTGLTEHHSSNAVVCLLYLFWVTAGHLDCEQRVQFQQRLKACLMQFGGRFPPEDWWARPEWEDLKCNRFGWECTTANVDLAKRHHHTRLLIQALKGVGGDVRADDEPVWQRLHDYEFLPVEWRAALEQRVRQLREEEGERASAQRAQWQQPKPSREGGVPDRRLKPVRRKEAEWEEQQLKRKQWRAPHEKANAQADRIQSYLARRLAGLPPEQQPAALCQATRVPLPDVLTQLAQLEAEGKVPAPRAALVRECLQAADSESAALCFRWPGPVPTGDDGGEDAARWLPQHEGEEGAQQDARAAARAVERGTVDALAFARALSDLARAPAALQQLVVELSATAMHPLPMIAELMQESSLELPGVEELEVVATQKDVAATAALPLAGGDCSLGMLADASASVATGDVNSNSSDSEDWELGRTSEDLRGVKERRVEEAIAQEGRDEGITFRNSFVSLLFCKFRKMRHVLESVAWAAPPASPKLQRALIEQRRAQPALMEQQRVHAGRECLHWLLLGWQMLVAVQQERRGAGVGPAMLQQMQLAAQEQWGAELLLPAFWPTLDGTTRQRIEGIVAECLINAETGEGFDPVCEGASILLALLALPAPAASSSTAAAAEAQAEAATAQKRALAEAVLGGLAHLQRRGRMVSTLKIAVESVCRDHTLQRINLFGESGPSITEQLQAAMRIRRAMASWRADRRVSRAPTCSMRVAQTGTCGSASLAELVPAANGDALDLMVTGGGLEHIAALTAGVQPPPQQQQPDAAQARGCTNGIGGTASAVEGSDVGGLELCDDIARELAEVLTGIYSGYKRARLADDAAEVAMDCLGAHSALCAADRAARSDALNRQALAALVQYDALHKQAVEAADADAQHLAEGLKTVAASLTAHSTSSGRQVRLVAPLWAALQACLRAGGQRVLDSAVAVLRNAGEVQRRREELFTVTFCLLQKMLGELQYGPCARPVLNEPAELLMRHLLPPRWEAEVEAQQEQEEEAAAAAAAALLEGEEKAREEQAAAEAAKRERKRRAKAAAKARQEEAKSLGAVKTEQEEGAARPEQEVAALEVVPAEVGAAALGGAPRSAAEAAAEEVAALVQAARAAQQAKGYARMQQEWEENTRAERERERRERKQEKKQARRLAKQQQQEQGDQPLQGHAVDEAVAPSPTGGAAAAGAGGSAGLGAAAQAVGEWPARTDLDSGSEAEVFLSAQTSPVAPAPTPAAPRAGAPAAAIQPVRTAAAAGAQAAEEHDAEFERLKEECLQEQVQEELQQKDRSERWGQRRREDIRFVSWDGDWLCHCGVVNPLKSRCQNPQCRQGQPCRDWFWGKCAKRSLCRNGGVHLPFDLPRAPPALLPGSAVFLAKPRPDARYQGPSYHRQQRVAHGRGVRLDSSPTQRASAPRLRSGSDSAQAPGLAGPGKDAASAAVAAPGASSSSADGAGAGGSWAAMARAAAAGAPPLASAGVPAADAANNSTTQQQQQQPDATTSWGIELGSDIGGGAISHAAEQAKPAMPPLSPHALGSPWAGVAGPAAFCGSWDLPADSSASTDALAHSAGGWGWGAPAGVPGPPGGAGAAAPPYSFQQQQQQQVDEKLEDQGELGDLLARMGVSTVSTGELGGAFHQQQPLAQGPWAAVPAGPVGAAEAAAVPLGTAAWPGLGEELPPPTQLPAPTGDEDEFDEELQAALQASLAEHQAEAEQSQYLAALTAAPAVGALAELPAELEGLAGLSNAAGEYNCFLNVIIQCLWSCVEFRQAVASWPREACATDDVVAALHHLFSQFAAQQAARRQAGADAAKRGSSTQRTVLNPTQLREALAALPNAQFQVGEMSDAGEVLLTLYERIHGMSQEAADQVDACFGLRVREAVNCGQCGRTTQQNEYTQFFFNTQATSLRVMGRLLGEGGSLSLGGLLRQIESQHQKSCDTDVGGCGALNPITHVLQGEPPRMFTVQLAWETNQVAPADIAATMQQVQEALDVGELYRGVEPGAHTYRLRAMACYYGAHYMAFVFAPDLGQWLLFDDAAVSRIGAWPDVVRKCEAGRIQPCVLFYAADR